LQRGKFIVLARKKYLMNTEPTSGESSSAETSSAESTEVAAKQWQALDHSQRRILGVLVEKAKTTPDGYPLSINALTNGCNQKSNRSPQMNLDSDDVEVSLSELRHLGVIGEIQGGGRVAKYRHYAKDWLGVDKFELAVMAELMLRGEQTLGDLRGRAARMEAIADIAALRPVVASLIEKELVIELSPAGRGQMITHNLYEPDELERLRKKFGPAPAATAGAPAAHAPQSSSPVQQSQRAPAAAPTPTAAAVDPNRLEELEVEVADLRSEVLELKHQVDNLQDKIDQIMS
jgi:uncharacterized protein YceH (UPF0502 family)